MSIFNRNTNKKHVEQFELKIAELLEHELPQLRKAIGLSKVSGIDFTVNPKGIYISRACEPNNFKLINNRSCFNLEGISVFNNESNSYKPVQLFYYKDSLTRIRVENPKFFHKVFDLNKIQKNTIQLEHLKLENPDREIAQKALAELEKDQIQLLELDDSFEIEIGEKLFYTILNMEDGNYVAVDTTGKIYRLSHDHTERIKLIADKPKDFFKLYNGEKSELEKIFE